MPRPTNDPPANQPATATVNALIYLRVSTVRQATKNGEAEGYSIPAQREACLRRARELGAEVIEEFIDAGASARSADRDGLQRMLTRVREGDISYVIVHKLDRLARSRIDDAEIATIFHLSGTTLVSASEQIDDSPSGSLLHGIMAAIAEHYSKNLSHEAKKGMAEKVRRGGTPNVAPLGYLNATQRVSGIEVKTVVVDPDRAHHVRWAFEQYATGDLAISDLRDALEERGLKSRTTRKVVGKPISSAQLHRMLTHPYYKGQVVFNGVIYDGNHEPLVDDVLWQRVQDVLAGRRIAGDRSWRHSHHLKGALYCARCGSRLGYGTSKGRGGEYDYFFCLGRHTKRTTCDLPYLAVPETEDAVQRQWAAVRFTDDQVAEFSQRARDDLHRSAESGSRLIVDQKRRLAELERHKQKLVDAYMADALPVDVLKERQVHVGAEIADAKRLIQSAQTASDEVFQRLEQVIALLRRAEQLYVACGPEARQLLNSAVFAGFYVDSSGEAGANGPTVAKAPLTPLVSAVVARPMPSPEETERTPGELLLTEGSNVTQLAVAVGFEPTVGLTPHNISSVAPSAARTRHRRRDYRRGASGLKSVRVSVVARRRRRRAAPWTLPRGLRRSPRGGG
jgi:site-specific DNA recombinase